MQTDDYAFSFAPCGWYAMYYCGVIQSLRDLKIVPREREKEDSLYPTTNHHVYTGSSAGALASFVLAYRLDIKELVSFCHDMSSKVRKDWKNNWNLQTLLQTFFEKYESLSVPNLNAECIRHINIQITDAKTMDQVYINNWNSYDDLRQTILASCTIPGIVGPPRVVKIQGAQKVWGIDGAFSTLQPSHQHQEHQHHQVTVSPFGWFSGTDIRPSVYMPIWWAFYPPDNKGLNLMYQMGYNDTLDWYHRHLIETSICSFSLHRVKYIHSMKTKGYIERIVGYETFLGLISCKKIEKTLNWILQRGLTSSVGYIVKAMNKTR